MCSIDFGVKRSQCIDYWKWFLAQNCLHFIPIITKHHIQTSHELRVGLVDFGIKRTSHPTMSSSNQPTVTANKSSHFLKRGGGGKNQKGHSRSLTSFEAVLLSNGQGHNALITKKWFARNCFPFTPSIMKLHTQTPNEFICLYYSCKKLW